VLPETTVSIAEHTKNPMATAPAFSCVPPKAYKELMNLVDPRRSAASPRA